MKKLTIDEVDFMVLALRYKLKYKNYKKLVDLIDAKLKQAYEQGKKDAAIKEAVIGGDGFFAGCKVYIDPSLPPNTVEMRFGKKVVKMALPKDWRE